MQKQKQDQVIYHRLQDTQDLMLSDAQYRRFAFKPHYHLDYHIGVITKGTQRQKLNGNGLVLGPGCISIMPPGQVHDGAGENQQDYLLKTFRLEPQLLEEYSIDMCEQEIQPYRPGAVVHNPALAKHLTNLHTSLAQQGQLAGLATEANLIEALQPILLQLHDIRPIEDKSGLNHQQINIIGEYCHAMLDQKVSLTQLAELLGLSRYQFLRRFAKSLGITPHAWLTQLRLEKACQLLRHTKASHSHIAAQVGFFDESHFSHAFKRHYGVTPANY